MQGGSGGALQTKVAYFIAGAVYGALMGILTMTVFMCIASWLGIDLMNFFLGMFAFTLISSAIISAMLKSPWFFLGTVFGIVLLFVVMQKLEKMARENSERDRRLFRGDRDEEAG